MFGSTRCPRCARHLPSDAAFCRRCGRDLRAPHGLAGADAIAPPLPRRAVPPPPVLAHNRGGGRFAIVAFAFFALLFIVGLLFSTRSPMRVNPAPPPADDTRLEDADRGDHDGAGSGRRAPQRQDSRKSRW